MDAVDVDIDLGTTEVDGVDCVTITLSSAQTHVMVHVPLGDLARFSQAVGRRWIDGAVRIGTCAGENVFWFNEDDQLTLLVGHDDQTWAISFSMPIECLAQIQRGLIA